MRIFLLIAIFICLYIIFKIYKNKKIITFNKINLYNWMNLTKKERYKLSNKESKFYFKRRKVLLDKIRKEYKSISKIDYKEH